MDVSLLEITDGFKVVGRPILYAMRDVRTHAVVAISAAYDNNSIIGLTGLLMNLAEDKKELCKRYNVTLKPQILR